MDTKFEPLTAPKAVDFIERHRVDEQDRLFQEYIFGHPYLEDLIKLLGCDITHTQHEWTRVAIEESLQECMWDKLLEARQIASNVQVFEEIDRAMRIRIFLIDKWDDLVRIHHQLYTKHESGGFVLYYDPVLRDDLEAAMLQFLARNLRLVSDFHILLNMKEQAEKCMSSDDSPSTLSFLITMRIRKIYKGEVKGATTCADTHKWIVALMTQPDAWPHYLNVYVLVAKLRQLLKKLDVSTTPNS